MPTTTTEWNAILGDQQQRREELLSDLREAADLLRRDARAAAGDKPFDMWAPISALSSTVDALTIDADESQVLEKIADYIRLRGQFFVRPEAAGYPFASPPVEVVRHIETGYTVPEDVPSYLVWRSLQDQSNRVTTIGTPLNGAVTRWAQHRLSDPENLTATDATRYGRLAAHVRYQLDRAAQRNPPGPRPVEPPGPVGPAVDPLRPPPRRPPASPAIPWGKVLLAAAGFWALSQKRGR